MIAMEDYKDALNDFMDLKQEEEVNLENIMERSHEFPVQFPVQSVRASTLMKNGVNRKTLQAIFASAYPVIDAKVLHLMATYLQHKRRYGNQIEKSVYSNLSLPAFVDRLLLKRPFAFLTSSDAFLLRDGVSKGSGDTFTLVGSSVQRPPVCLRDYLSYDEMKLSSLISVTSKSLFINRGDRHNKGAVGKAGTFEVEGVIVGMVGARFEKSFLMECQDCMITPEQSTTANGYGASAAGEKAEWLEAWAHHWDLPYLPTWEESVTYLQRADPNERSPYIQISENSIFNSVVYKARTQAQARVLLAEANARASEGGQRAYVQVVGLGLGVWCAGEFQKQLFVDAWAECLPSLDISCIAHLDFCWINVDHCEIYLPGATSQFFRDGDTYERGTGIKIHFSKRNLHDPLPEPGLLLVCSYAWDSNAYPGNEFWLGLLTASGDPAAASSSQVAEVHNVLINERVNAGHLRVVTSHGLERVDAFACRVLEINQ